MAIALTGVLFVTAGFCGIIALIVYHVKRMRLYSEAAKFTGPRVLPVLGNAHYFVGNTADILSKIISLLDSYPSPFRVWLGGRLFFGVYDAEHMKTIFLSPKAIEKEDLYKFARPWLGTGLFTAPAAKWRIHRKLIMPTFNQKILESFVEIFAKQSEIMTKQMRKELKKGEFDIFYYVSLCTLDIICETAMGVTVQAQMGNGTRYVDSAKRVFEIVYSRMFKIWLHPDFIFNLTKLGKDQRECLKYLHGVTNDVIQKKKSAYRNATRVENETGAPERATTRKAFLDLLMELSNDGAKLTDEELREEVDTMMIAGNDTTASVNSFVMMMLANFPEIQRFTNSTSINPITGFLVFKEIRKIFVVEVELHFTYRLGLSPSSRAVPALYLENQCARDFNKYIVQKDFKSPNSKYRKKIRRIKSEKVYQELCDIYGNEVSSDTPVKNEDLGRMEYMERVIKETMRLFPVGPILVRHMTEDIKIGDYTLPKGSSAVLGIIKLHRWEKYWPDPLKFDPDRFLPEEVAKRHPYCYVPFSAGPRNCLGLKYAMMAMKALLATVLRRYVLKKDKFVNIEDIKLKADVMLKPVEPLTVKIIERTVDPNISNE